MPVKAVAFGRTSTWSLTGLESGSAAFALKMTMPSTTLPPVAIGVTLSLATWARAAGDAGGLLPAGTTKSGSEGPNWTLVPSVPQVQKIQACHL